MARGKEEAPEDSGFASVGRKEIWPPTYEDSKDMSFVDESRWPTQKLLGRLSLYEEFLKQDYPMERARKEARRVKDHIMLELLCREGYFNYIYEVEDERTEDTGN